jgi:hypothetical protein
MSKVLLGMGMSLDGYVIGPDVTPQEPMGRGGKRLHVTTCRSRCVEVHAGSATVLDTSMSPRSKRPSTEEAR